MSATQSSRNGKPKNRPGFIWIEVPIAEPEGGNPQYIDKLETRMNTSQQRHALRVLLSGLKREHAEVDVGGTLKPVWRHAEAARWLLDQIAEKVS